MYRVLEAKSLIFVVFVVFAASFFLVGLLYSSLGPKGLQATISDDFARILGLSSSLANVFLLFVASNKWIFRQVWRVYRLANKDAFPDISGTWDVQLKSNFPIYSKLVESACHQGPAFNVLTDIDDNDGDLKVMSGKAEIDVSFLSIEIRLNFDDDRFPSHSVTLSASPIKKVTGIPFHQLAYVYHSSRPDTVPNDQTEHLGAGKVDILDNGSKLSGIYWTNRNWKQAANTAGRITYSRS